MKDIEKTEAEANEPLMPDEGLPEWWPENPYSEPVRMMTPEEFAEAVPDEELRTRISGCCCKEFWRMASDRIEQCLRFRLKEIERTEAETPPAACEQCVELAEALNALLEDYEYMMFEEGHGGPPGNMLVARTLLNEISDGVYTYE